MSGDAGLVGYLVDRIAAKVRLREGDVPHHHHHAY